MCPTCGTRIWHGDPEKEDTIKLRAGTLDAPVDITNAVHIWTQSKLPGVIIPAGAKTFEQAPN